jgi:hypothetical protein
MRATASITGRASSASSFHSALRQRYVEVVVGEQPVVALGLLSRERLRRGMHGLSMVMLVAPAPA